MCFSNCIIKYNVARNWLLYGILCKLSNLFKNIFLHSLTVNFLSNSTRGCPMIIWTGLNIKIGIVQKVYEWSSCPFAKMISRLENHYGKIPAWSLIYFLNYAYFDIQPSLLTFETPSIIDTHKTKSGSSKRNLISW